MTRPVMVPLDGSEKDAWSLPIAAALADLSGAGLHLVRVVDPPSGISSARARLHGEDAASAPDRQDAERRVAELAERLAADTGHQVTSAVLAGVDVADELIQHAARQHALAVVMATRAPGAAGRALVGSVADVVMRTCPRPVVLVPPGAAFMRGKRVRIGRVLVPLDGSALATRALDFVLEQPRATELEYVLLQVVPPSHQGDSPDLDRAAARVRARGVTAVETGVIPSDDPAATIVAAVREYLVEMIVMSTRGRSGLQRLVLGSVAEGVVRASEMPVLLITPASLAGS